MDALGHEHRARGHGRAQLDGASHARAVGAHLDLIALADAERLGIREGDQVEVGSNGTRVKGAVKLRAAVPGGSVFIAAGTHEQPANVLTEPMVEVRKAGNA